MGIKRSRTNPTSDRVTNVCSLTNGIRLAASTTIDDNEGWAGHSIVLGREPEPYSSQVVCCKMNVEIGTPDDSSSVGDPISSPGIEMEISDYQSRCYGYDMILLLSQLRLLLDTTISCIVVDVLEKDREKSLGDEKNEARGMCETKHHRPCLSAGRQSYTVWSPPTDSLLLLFFRHNDGRPKTRIQSIHHTQSSLPTSHNEYPGIFSAAFLK